MSQQLEIKRTATCSAPPDVVFDALVDESLVEEWMTAEAEIQPREGGAVTITADGWIEMTGEIIVFEPPTHLALHWDTRAGTLITDITLAEAPSGSRLTLSETGFGNAADVAVRDNLWSHWLIRLSAVVGVRRS